MNHYSFAIKCIAQQWDEHSKKSIEEFKAALVKIFTMQLKLETFKWWERKHKVPRRFRFPRDEYMPSEAIIQKMEQNNLKQVIYSMESQRYDVVFLKKDKVEDSKRQLEVIVEECDKRIGHMHITREEREDFKESCERYLAEALEEYNKACTDTYLAQSSICEKKIKKALGKLDKMEEREQEKSEMELDSLEEAEYRNQRPDRSPHARQRQNVNARPRQVQAPKTKGKAKPKAKQKVIPIAKPKARSKKDVGGREGGNGKGKGNGNGKLLGQQRQQRKPNKRSNYQY